MGYGSFAGYIILFIAIVALCTLAYHQTKLIGVYEESISQFQIVFEDKVNDQKISSRPDSGPMHLLDRMRDEN